MSVGTCGYVRVSASGTSKKLALPLTPWKEARVPIFIIRKTDLQSWAPALVSTARSVLCGQDTGPYRTRVSWEALIPVPSRQTLFSGRQGLGSSGKAHEAQQIITN